MRNRMIPAAAMAALIHLVAPAAAASDFGGAAHPADAEMQPRFAPPFFHRDPNDAPPLLSPEGAAPLPSARPIPGTDGARDTPPAPDRAADAPPSKPPTRAETLDTLLNRLAKAGDAGEAQGIARLVERMWMQSGSDTADLLMTRAVAAMNGDRRDVAAALFDQIIALQPGWAEAWNKRATLRFLQDDDVGSMEDISHVLALEPRHFGALSGMGFILERHGDDKAALRALRRALAVYPQDADVRKAVDKLTPAVEGQEL